MYYEENQAVSAKPDIINELVGYLRDNGTCDPGFCRLSDGPEGLPFAISIAVPLSAAIVDEITDRPTFTYFHHYRTINAYIDRLLLGVGLILQKRGWRYLPVPASQSEPSEGNRTHQGRYSHKKAAVSAGLGSIGRSALFLHNRYGARVRLGTLFTDYPLPLPVCDIKKPDICLGCQLCVQACPAGAIKGALWQPGQDRDELVDAQGCNDYMRSHFMKIGRGSVCGICMKVCPYNN